MDFILALGSGFLLGCTHAFDADHLVAVSTFASKNPRPTKAVRFGVLWGLGHTFTVFSLGLVTLAFKFVISPRVESVAEIFVGILLVLIGTWALTGVLRKQHIHIHTHTHDGKEHIHFHSHSQTSAGQHKHEHSMLIVGATHGLAGTATVMVIVPVALSQSITASAFFLLLFGVGTIFAMAVFAFLIGTLSSHARRFQSSVQAFAGALSVCIGLLWILQRI